MMPFFSSDSHPFDHQGRPLQKHGHPTGPNTQYVPEIPSAPRASNTGPQFRPSAESQTRHPMDSYHAVEFNPPQQKRAFNPPGTGNFPQSRSPTLSEFAPIFTQMKPTLSQLKPDVSQQRTNFQAGPSFGADRDGPNKMGYSVGGNPFGQKPSGGMQQLFGNANKGKGRFCDPIIFLSRIP